MQKSLRPTTIVIAGTNRSVDVLVTEIVRKSIHMLIACVPILAAYNTGATLALLASGIIAYTYAETLRLRGRDIILISRVTAMASRDRDAGKFVLGPITLGLGAMLALLLYPSPASAIAIYALAFGDGLASIIGKMFGTVRIPFTGGKTVEGSLACLLAVLAVSYRATGDAVGSLEVAFVATILEALPIRDFDNIILPIGVGLVSMRLFM
jgi:phytol kinase